MLDCSIQSPFFFNEAGGRMTCVGRLWVRSTRGGQLVHIRDGTGLQNH